MQPNNDQKDLLRDKSAPACIFELYLWIDVTLEKL